MTFSHCQENEVQLQSLLLTANNYHVKEEQTELIYQTADKL